MRYRCPQCTRRLCRLRAPEPRHEPLTADSLEVGRGAHRRRQPRTRISSRTGAPSRPNSVATRSRISGARWRICVAQAGWSALTTSVPATRRTGLDVRGHRRPHQLLPASEDDGDQVGASEAQPAGHGAQRLGHGNGRHRRHVPDCRSAGPSRSRPARPRSTACPRRPRRPGRVSPTAAGPRRWSSRTWPAGSCSTRQADRRASSSEKTSSSRSTGGSAASWRRNSWVARRKRQGHAPLLPLRGMGAGRARADG